VWDDDAALDAFEAEHPLARRFAAAGGPSARLEPLRAVGAWSAMPALVDASATTEHAGDEPVAVLTYGRLRPRRLYPFLRASQAAEAAALASPALLASTGLACPPRIVATFSLWRSASEMRADAAGSGGAHVAAMRAQREDDFHTESLFARFRPYATRGAWADALRGARPALTPAA